MITTLEKAKSWDELQARIYLDNQRRAMSAIIPMTAVLLIGFNAVPVLWLVIMGILLICLQSLRFWYTRPEVLPQEADPDQAQQAIRIVNIISAIGGVWVGVAAMLILPALEPGWATVLSIIILGMQAGSIATTAVHPPTFITYTLPIFLGFSAGWWLSDTNGSLVIPPLYLLFALVLFGAVRNGHAALRSSYDLRVERNVALQKAEDANRQKAKFLATASHDLRQPAAALAFMSEELSAAETSPELKPVVSAIARSSNNLNSLIDTLFDLSKLDRALINNDPQWVSLKELCANQRSIIGPKASAKGIEFTIDCVEGFLFVDPSHIQRWLGNLLDNAVKYTTKGTVTLRIELIPTGLLITVEDTGRGIAPEQLENIWSEYFRAEQNSTAGAFSLGLGLSIVRKLSQLLGVEPTIKSIEQQGTSISAEFPRSAYQLETSALPAGRSWGRMDAAEGKNLLLVEDNPDVAEALERHLSTLGFNVDFAADAPAARSLLSGDKTYAVMLTDNRLPGNELGTELCLYANQNGRIQPCLLISADELGPDLLPDGIPLARLQKPLQTNQLRLRLSELLTDNPGRADTADG